MDQGSPRRIALTLLARVYRAAGALANPVLRGLVGATGSSLPLEDHLAGAVDWLLEANRNVPQRLGFSLGYYLDAGQWQAAYVETTGYILPTLFRFARHSSYRREEVLDAARRSGEWLVNVQFRDGSYGNPSHYVPTVFDTGQVIFGLLALYRDGGSASALAAAVRAGEWLCACQNASGCWELGAYHDQGHTYYAEVSWALLLLWKASGDERFRRAAERNLGWVLGNQRPNGFYERASFDEGTPPILHAVAYAIQGVLESGLVLADESLIQSARRAADALAAEQKRAGILRARYDAAWRSRARYRCLTGLAQMGVVWSRLFQRFGDEAYREQAARLVGYLRRRQLVAARQCQLRGGLLGSAPAWGGYFPFRLPNWGVKFYLDLLLFGHGDQGREWRLVRRAVAASADHPGGFVGSGA